MTSLNMPIMSGVANRKVSVHVSELLESEVICLHREQVNVLEMCIIFEGWTMDVRGWMRRCAHEDTTSDCGTRE